MDAKAMKQLCESINGVAEGLQAVALAIQNLGNGNAATSMGAIEAHSVKMSETIALAAGEIALAIQMTEH